MELSNLQGQLKVAIQKHQIIVAKMKNDEHNAALQKQLRELQAEIISLGEKQKCVVENLRKERDLNPNKVQQQQQITKTTKAITATTLSSLSTNTVNVIPSNARFIISTTENKSRQISVNTGAQSHGLSFRVEKPLIKSGSIVPPVPTAAQKIIHQVVPSIVSNLVANANSNALKATVVFPSLSASQTSAIINASNRVVNLKSSGVTTANSSSVSTAISNSSPSSSVLVVPSPISSCRPSSDSLTLSSSNPTIVTNSTSTTTTSSASFVLKLGSPIRVPQYPPPNSRPATSTVDSCGSCVVTAVENAPLVKKEKKIPQPLSLPANDTKTIDVKPIKLKTEKAEDSTKMNFMTALGLINREVMNELQSKRGERKRRTTANPQFSNAAIEEKKRNAAALLSAAAANPSLKIKKPRGRQKLNVSPIQSPTPTPPTTPSATSIATSIAITTTNSRIENGANIFISRNGTNLVITNTTTQCNSLDNLPVGVHHVRVKSEPSLSQSSFGGNVSSSYDCVPLNCSKKFVTPSAVMAVNKNVLNHNKIANSSSYKTSADNGNILTTKVDSLIKPIPKNNILNGCLKTVLNKNGGILSDVILCGICHLRLGAGSGDMLACFGCKRPYHTRCAAKVVPQLNDGKIVNKNAHWKCPKCAICISASTISSPAASSSSVTLTVPVKTSFTHHQPWKKDTPLPIPVRTEKQVKEEEKQRHLKRSKELNEEMARLKDKRQRLADVQAANLKRQAELAAAKKSTEAALNKMHETVNMVRNRIS